MAVEWLLDIGLGTLILALAITVLHARNLYTSMILFIAFGLVLAFIWARLNAPDLALAEAVIGAGLTGALLLAALSGTPERQKTKPHARPLHRLPGLLLSGLILATLIQAALPLTETGSGLPEAVQANLSGAGAKHPVTAVLLNFRGWDTLLELFVILLALMAVRQLLPTLPRSPAPWPILLAWSRLLAPVIVLVGGYLLWRGSSYPGGAFQAGSLIAAAAILLRLTGLLPALGWQQLWLRGLVLCGGLTFLLTAAATAFLGEGLLAYPAGWAGPLILLIEIMATLSIAATLTLLVVGESREVRA